MKRRDLEQHLREHGCVFHHHGGNHDFWYHLETKVKTPIPRHSEVKPSLARRICKQLSVPTPNELK